MTVQVVREISPAIPEKADDLFLGCVSFEERCVNVARRLSQNTTFRNAVLFRYEGRDEGDRRESNQRVLKDLLSSHSLSLPTIIKCDKSDPLDGMNQLSETMKVLSRENPRVTVDATAFTKQYLLVLLHELNRSIGSYQLRLTYTRGIFGGDLSNPPTWGISAIRPVPYFNPILQDVKSRILVIILGFEPRRALAVFRDVGAARTIAVIPDPPSNPAGELRCRLMNARILKDQSVEQLTASELDPDDTADVLRELGNGHPEAGICISPLGSKMQTVGVFKALMASRDKTLRNRAQVVYAAPAMYNEEYYTIGFVPEPLESSYGVKQGLWTSAVTQSGSPAAS